MTDDIRKDSTCDKTASISKVDKCTCVYATARNTPSVASGYEMGGYVKEECDHCRRPESATTPAEVDSRIRVLMSERDRALEANATLARQISASEASLAEAKERMRELEAQRDDYLNREWVAEKAKRKAESQLAEAVSLLEEALDQMKSDEISLDWEFGSCSLSSKSPLEDWSPTIQQIVKYLQENKNE